MNLHTSPYIAVITAVQRNRKQQYSAVTKSDRGNIIFSHTALSGLLFYFPEQVLNYTEIM